LTLISYDIDNSRCAHIQQHQTPLNIKTDESKACEYGLRIKPKKGNAAMFYSLEEENQEEGKTDPWSLHCGCDVLKGEKWIANQWIWNAKGQFI